MYKGKIDKLINEINKIARLKRISYKLENIYEEYDEFIEDYYFMEWLRMSQDGITQIEELNTLIAQDSENDDLKTQLKSFLYFTLYELKVKEFPLDFSQ